MNYRRIALLFALTFTLSLAGGCCLFGSDDDFMPPLTPVDPISDGDAGQADDEGRRPRPPIGEGPGIGQDGRLVTVYFDFDRSTIRPDQIAALERNAEYLLEHTDYGVLIEGHCDERGTVEYNLALGDRRARAAKDFLVSRGVGAERIDTLSKGEEEPAVEGSTEAAYARNRRCEFLLTQ